MMVAIGELETPIATTELLFEVRDIKSVEGFRVMANLANPFLGLLFLQHNCTVLEGKHGILKLSLFHMQLKDANKSYPSYSEPIFNPHKILHQPGKQTIIWVRSKLCKKHEVTGTLQLSQHTENNNELNI